MPTGPGDTATRKGGERVSSKKLKVQDRKGGGGGGRSGVWISTTLFAAISSQGSSSRKTRLLFVKPPEHQPKQTRPGPVGESTHP